ncbi:MAG: asparagine synthase (glutamine-hydrolyzing) [Verrucomicrobiota bacterium]|jgi:asparagine synthase (glutamine-hydrolysing)
MCGIAAIFVYHNSASLVDQGELISIRDAMTSRGPDGCGVWLSPDRRVGFGHRRLSIVDLSPAGSQPMQSQDGALIVTFNGEIYNHRELRSRLEQEGCRFRSTCDTEVLLHLYRQRGESMVEDLRGMYAFALWDARERGLFLARDPLGVKPLYYADDGATIRVASQVKALLAGGRVDTAPQPAGHVGFFLWGHVPSPYTLYRGVQSLPAGTTLWIDQAGGKRQKTFCSVTGILAHAEESNPPATVRHSPSSRETLHAALRDSVRHHLIADVPVGVFLSSGLDSTTLAALAAGEGGTLRTVTLGFEEFRGTPDDETPLAERVARHYGTTHETIWVTRADFRAHLGRLLGAMDQPSIDGVNTYFVSLAAARTSLKAALSGLGGDELFGGYASFRDIPRAVRALGFFRRGGPLGRMLRVLSAPLLKRMTSPKYAGLLEYGGTYAGAYLLRRGLFMPWELPGVLDPEIVRQGWAELQPLLRLDEKLEGLSSPRLRVSCLETTCYMRDQLLRDSDWAGMAHSLEIRVPLVDVELLRRLAPLLASDTPPTKQDLADSPGKKLPDEVLRRPKTGFSIPVRDWLMEGNPAAGGRRGLRGWAETVYQKFIP